MEFKEKLKANPFIYSGIKKIRKFQFSYYPYLQTTFVFNMKKYFRIFGIDRKNPYKRLKKIKDKHKGERCFIIATGPSLTIEDLEKLKDEITIGMNSICLAFDETDWRPTYYGIQDENVYARLRGQIESLDVECKFISHTILERLNIAVTNNDYIFPMDMLNHHIENHKYNTRFSNNAFAVVYNGYTVTYSLIQIAVYMGFKEIYLIGTDCNYSNDMKHHFKEYGHVDPTYLSAGEMMISAYKVAKKYADRNNIKIYNATRGGMLEVFERVNLDDLLKESGSEQPFTSAGVTTLL
ncbi:6-hydroxymethylpterin diphosphokinase MptE-like protein [Neobacillus muris]|uniref:6-hydroxymethylpterin diphosphokinase MptE-like protein n=1 Tax=Neobacillus muris TaxID=2941334 RepID=UPI002040EF16|nr:6-hydroxymethylpterin diphosphokinase MptE-like protein [Neobacillus muris]